MKTNPNRLALALTLALASPMALAATTAPEHHGQTNSEQTRDADRPDAWVTGKVKSKLAMSSEISALDINVDTENGITTLRGTVDNRAQEEEALRLARETVGANEVRSALVIDPNATDRQRERNERTPAERHEARQDHRTAKHDRMHRDAADRPDAWLLTKVKSQMLASTDVGGLDINVDVDDGVVTLRGNVETQAEASEAVRIAQSTEGVRRVNSQLVVSGD